LICVYLDLKEPLGWRFSNLRKILLLRFRRYIRQFKFDMTGVLIPFCSLRQRAGFLERSLDPGFLLLLRRG